MSEKTWSVRLCGSFDVDPVIEKATAGKTFRVPRYADGEIVETNLLEW